MADTYLSLRVHLVWATKNRKPWLDPEWRPRLFACVGQIIARKGGRLLCAGGVRDHVHLYLEPPGTVTIAELVATLKANTTRWIHQTFAHRRDFKWQHGYGAFTVTGLRRRGSTRLHPQPGGPSSRTGIYRRISGPAGTTRDRLQRGARAGLTTAHDVGRMGG